MTRRALLGTLVFRLDDNARQPEQFMRCLWRGRDDQLVEIASVRANMLDELSIERFRDLCRDLTEAFSREVFPDISRMEFNPPEE